MTERIVQIAVAAHDYMSDEFWALGNEGTLWRRTLRTEWVNGDPVEIRWERVEGPAEEEARVALLLKSVVDEPASVDPESAGT